ncbi:MAG: DUF1206 domain-containing protein [Balneolaceae bacterium]|nr:DUF1206 domain-containing protein [Balneolaceae bacterium]
MIDKVQTLGLAAKGLVYSIIGALTAMAAFDMGGQMAGKSHVISFLQQQPFGNFLLYFLAAGILAYAIWRMYTAIADPKNKGTGKTGITKRVGYFFSSIIYLFFSITIVTTTITSAAGDSNRQFVVDHLLQKTYGPFVIGLIGVIIIGVGLYQIHKGYSKKYLEELNAGYGNHQSLMHKVGKFGFIARGIIFGIIGYFVLRAGVTDNPEMIRSIQGAFSFLQQQSYGTYLMGGVAVGLMAYGIFMMYVSKDSRIHA